MMKRLATCFPVALLAAAAGAVRAEPSDEAFIEGLRARRLFSLAETYCRDRLAEADLSDPDRAELVIELARTYAQHALNTSPAERGPLASSPDSARSASI